MKLTIGDYEVEIEARKRCHEKASEKDTEAFLQLVALAFGTAAVRAFDLDCDVFAGKLNEMCDGIVSKLGE